MKIQILDGVKKGKLIVWLSDVRTGKIPQILVKSGKERGK